MILIPTKILRFANPYFIGLELFCTLLIILLCVLIFLKTKDIFNLTKHKGIFYFRNTFLFLAFAYLIRFFMVLIKLNSQPPFAFKIYFPIFHLLVSYFSTIAIFSLFLSTTWRKFKSKYTFIFANFIALLISILSFLIGEPQLITLIQLLIFVTTIIISIKNHNKYKLAKSNKHFSNLLLIYILLFLFWFISMFPLGRLFQIPYEYILPSQIFSTIIFIIIYFKVRKKLN